MWALGQARCLRAPPSPLRFGAKSSRHYLPSDPAAAQSPDRWTPRFRILVSLGGSQPGIHRHTGPVSLLTHLRVDRGHRSGDLSCLRFHCVWPRFSLSRPIPLLVGSLQLRPLPLPWTHCFRFAAAPTSFHSLLLFPGVLLGMAFVMPLRTPMPARCSSLMLPLQGSLLITLATISPSRPCS